jgi:hypothetical protein
MGSAFMGISMITLKASGALGPGVTLSSDIKGKLKVEKKMKKMICINLNSNDPKGIPSCARVPEA